jgi:hypothetical protein
MTIVLIIRRERDLHILRARIQRRQPGQPGGIGAAVGPGEGACGSMDVAVAQVVADRGGVDAYGRDAVGGQRTAQGTGKKKEF